jgi:hypothetical protein
MGSVPFKFFEQLVEPCHATVIGHVGQLGFAAREAAEIFWGVNQQHRHAR